MLWFFEAIALSVTNKRNAHKNAMIPVNISSMPERLLVLRKWPPHLFVWVEVRYHYVFLNVMAQNNLSTNIKIFIANGYCRDLR